MNKAGAPASGPTAASAAAAAQKQKALLQKVDTDISTIVDSFSLLVGVSRVNETPVRNSQEAFLMEIRAAKLVQSADSLLKMVSDLKQTAIFSGFASLNENVDRRIETFKEEADRTEKLLERVGEEAAASLRELESHYYGSVVRSDCMSDD